MGARNKPFYRLVVADSRFATTGRFLEVLGWYDPKQKADNFSVNLERVNYWLGTGAQLSTTAKNLVKKAEAGEGVPVGAAPAKKAQVAPVAEEAAPVEESAPAAEAVAEEVSEKQEA
jgi:small subunit ribosomal protein S16